MLFNVALSTTEPVMILMVLVVEPTRGVSASVTLKVGAGVAVGLAVGVAVPFVVVGLAAGVAVPFVVVGLAAGVAVPFVVEVGLLVGVAVEPDVGVAAEFPFRSVFVVFGKFFNSCSI